eukprot:Pgem_evm1s14469
MLPILLGFAFLVCLSGLVSFFVTKGWRRRRAINNATSTSTTRINQHLLEEGGSRSQLFSKYDINNPDIKYT